MQRDLQSVTASEINNTARVVLLEARLASLGDTRTIGPIFDHERGISATCHEWMAYHISHATARIHDNSISAGNIVRRLARRLSRLTGEALGI
jgi:hypothetical protein